MDDLWTGQCHFSGELASASYSGYALRSMDFGVGDRVVELKNVVGAAINTNTQVLFGLPTQNQTLYSFGLYCNVSAFCQFTVNNATVSTPTLLNASTSYVLTVGVAPSTRRVLLLAWQNGTGVAMRYTSTSLNLDSLKNTLAPPMIGLSISFSRSSGGRFLDYCPSSYKIYSRSMFLCVMFVMFTMCS